MRQAGLAARRAILPQERARLDAAICAHILRLAAFQNARVILSYRRMPDEAGVDGVGSAAASLGKQVAYPVCMDCLRMEAYAPLDETAWTTGAFGIIAPQPQRSSLFAPEEIDFVLAPCTAFDAQNNRIGMGAGYYDRYLARCPNAVVCLVAYEAQRAAHIEPEVHDRPAHLAVTERGCYDREQRREEGH